MLILIGWNWPAYLQLWSTTQVAALVAVVVILCAILCGRDANPVCGIVYRCCADHKKERGQKGSYENLERDSSLENQVGHRTRQSTAAGYGTAVNDTVRSPLEASNHGYA